MTESTRSTNTISKKRLATAQRIIEALESSNGLLTMAAKKAQLDYSTVYRYAQEFPSVKAAMEKARESMLDTAESELFKKIKRGDNVAIIFYLKTQGKCRGYIERQEVTGDNGQPIILKVVYDSSNKD